MTNRSGILDEDDLQQWQEAMTGVTPLARRAATVTATPPPAQARMRRCDDADALAESLCGPIDPDTFETGDQTSFRRHGVRPATVRKLRRGQFAIQDSIDLHGLTRQAAHELVQTFLAETRRRQMRCVRIIHGKGLRSPRGEPVLKARVETALQRHADVLAYCSAPPWAGGFGAVLVLLR